jgi:hypothetical protein
LVEGKSYTDGHVVRVVVEADAELGDLEWLSRNFLAW